MKCPYRKRIQEVDGIKSEHYMECYGEECPYYVPERQYSYGLTSQPYCNRVELRSEAGI